MKIKTQWGTIDIPDDKPATRADLIEMADAAFGDEADAWLATHSDSMLGMPCGSAWDAMQKYIPGFVTLGQAATTCQQAT